MVGGQTKDSVMLGHIANVAEKFDTKTAFASQGKITRARLYEWKAGESEPTTDDKINLGLLAKERGLDSDALFFWEQAGITLEIAQAIGRSVVGEANEGVKIPPYRDQSPLPFEIKLPAPLVAGASSTFYIVASGASQFAPVGQGVSEGEIVIFDADSTDPYNLLSEIVVAKFKDGLFVGHVAWMGTSEHSLLAIGPRDALPNGWAHWLHSEQHQRVRVIEAVAITEKRPDGRSTAYQGKVWECSILGKYIAQISQGHSRYLKMVARIHAPRK